MRLGIQILGSSASLNSFKPIQMVKVARGETLDIFFRLVDLDQDGLRYIADTLATAIVNIPRSLQVLAGQGNTRSTADYSISRVAVNPFAGDRSIWKISILSSETVNFIGNSIRVTLNEPSAIRIATAASSIKVIDDQNS